ncbi:hypothetical protein [Methylobacter sp.]|jgi:hypothetical protein|uniref:phage tail tube protein n=1 Tax=Methylobacter sp. TaxID=2051955 RepID=UPI003DA46DA3
MVALTNEGFLLEGTLYFDRLDDAGAATGLVTLPGVAKLAMKPTSEIKDQTSKDKGQYGQIIGSVAIPKPVELSLSLRNGTKEGIALGLMGSHSTISAGAGTVTDEAVTAKLDVWKELAQRNITAASVVVTNDGATTTYVEGTDYEINYSLGMIRAIPTGDITEAQALKVDYAHAAISGWKVAGGTKPQAKGRLILDGRNLLNNKTVRLEIYRALLTSDSDFDTMGDDVVEFGLSGRMETPSGKTEPFILEQW